MNEKIQDKLRVQEQAALATKVAGLEAMLVALMGRVAELEKGLDFGSSDGSIIVTRVGRRVDLIVDESAVDSGGADLPGFSGQVRVAGVKFTSAQFTGTPSDFLKVFFDDATPPAYTGEATWAAAWPDDYVVIRLSEQAGTYILPRG